MQQPELGKRISELRLAKGLTQSELAETCNLSLRTIQRIELAEVVPRSDTIKRIFNSMGYDFYNSDGWNSKYKVIISQVWDFINLKQNKMKKLVFFTLIVFLTIVGILVSNIKTNASDKNSSSIEGAWRYVSYDIVINGRYYSNFPEGSNYSEMKIWSKGHFAYVGTQSFAGSSFGGSGYYTLDGTFYTEKIIYCADASMVGKTVKLYLEIKNDTLTQIWPADESGHYDKMNYRKIKMVRLEQQPKVQTDWWLPIVENLKIELNDYWVFDRWTEYNNFFINGTREVSADTIIFKKGVAIGIHNSDPNSFTIFYFDTFKSDPNNYTMDFKKFEKYSLSPINLQKTYYDEKIFYNMWSIKEKNMVMMTSKEIE